MAKKVYFIGCIVGIFMISTISCFADSSVHDPDPRGKAAETTSTAIYKTSLDAPGKMAEHVDPQLDCALKLLCYQYPGNTLVKTDYTAGSSEPDPNEAFYDINTGKVTIPRMRALDYYFRVVLQHNGDWVFYITDVEQLDK